MPKKKGAGGRLQNYDPNTGRYKKSTNILENLTINKMHPTKAQKDKMRMNYLINCAKNKGDKYVLDALLYIEKYLPHSVLAVNCLRMDPNIEKIRELDIITTHHVIEVKGGKGGRLLKQLISQKKYADSINKKYVVFSPNIAKVRKYEYNKCGIHIVTSLKELIDYLKERWNERYKFIYK